MPALGVARHCCEELVAAHGEQLDIRPSGHGGDARDIAQQFYFAEAAAQLHGLTFRAVANQTWKKTYLGRGNMRSDEALLAYTTKGHEAHPHVTRWAGTTVAALGEADDAAALGVAHHWLSTEST
mgnify:CR=1 FL=1